MKKSAKVVLIAATLMLVLTGCCLKHEWKDPTCVNPKTCAVCDKTKGEALGHVWTDATCVEINKEKLLAMIGKLRAVMRHRPVEFVEKKKVTS